MRLTKIEQFKQLLGKEIIAIGTGNNARNGGIKRTFAVNSVGRKYVNLNGVNYLPETGATQKAIAAGYSYNAGFMFFKSQSDADDYIFDYEKRDELRCVARSAYDWTKNLSTSDVIALLLKIKGD